MSGGNTDSARVARRTGLGFPSRSVAAIALACAVALGVAGCGGGADVQGDGFSISVSVDGRSSGGPVDSGGRQSVSIYAGQSVALDASEPVAWTLYAGNVAVPADGSTVIYGGASIRVTAVSSSRIVVDTAAAGPLPTPVPVTLVATSTFDAALVATVNLYVY